MTHVILENEKTDQEMYISFPTYTGEFSYYLKMVKLMRPNANWKPLETWET